MKVTGEKQPHAIYPNRWADGTQRPNTKSFNNKHTVVLRDPEVQRRLADRRDEIIVQRGGRDRLSPMMLGLIDRFTILEAFTQSWEQYFVNESPITRQGRTRSGYATGYLASIAALMKLGQQIGVERVAADAMTLQDWLHQIGDEAERERQQQSEAETATEDPADHEEQS